MAKKYFISYDGKTEYFGKIPKGAYSGSRPENKNKKYLMRWTKAGTSLIRIRKVK